MTVNYMHINGVIHRDLKPENILLEANKDYSQIKIIDFGTAIRHQSSDKLTDRIGTPYYIAPEVLAQNYDSKCDIWSLGVTAFILLTGMKPFTGNTDTEVFKAVKQGNPNFHDISWLGISKEAKTFVMELLNPDPNHRPSALQALNSEWMRNTAIHVDNEEFVKAAHNLKAFNSESLFKRAAYQFISK